MIRIHRVNYDRSLANFMSKDCFVRLYQQGDENEIVKLLELVFNGWPHFDLECTPLDYWKWKYLDNPIKNQIIAIAHSNNRIICCNHSILVKISIDNKSQLSSQGADMAVHPEFRRMGLFKKTTELKNRIQSELNMKIFFGLTSNPIMIKTSRKMGRRFFPKPILPLARIQNISLHLKNQKSKTKWFVPYGYHLVKIANKLGKAITSLPTSASSVNILLKTHFDDRIDLFCDEIKDFYNFIIERNSEYLNYRYCDPRGGKYIIKTAEEGGRIVGYSVIRVNRYSEEYPEGYIVDLLTLPDRLDVASDLISDAIRCFDDKNVNIIRTWVVKGHPFEQLFKLHGFLDTRWPPSMQIESLNIGTEWEEFITSTADRLYFQYGDTDWI